MLSQRESYADLELLAEDGVLGAERAFVDVVGTFLDLTEAAAFFELLWKDGVVFAAADSTFLDFDFDFDGAFLDLMTPFAC